MIPYSKILFISMIFLPILNHGQELNSKMEIFKLEQKFTDNKEYLNDLLKRDEEFSLIIGYFDSNEILIINSDTTITGNVLLMNNGRLIINKDIKVLIEGSIFCINTSALNISNCKLNVKGNLMFTNNSRFLVDSSEFSMPMEYRYQFELGAFDSAEILIKNSKISFDKGTLGGFFTDYSKLTLKNDSFLQSVTISMTGHSELIADNIQYAWEFLIKDSCNIHISNSLGFILWFYFQGNTISNASFPQGNFVDSFVFNNSVSGLENISYSVKIDSTAYVKWGIFPEKGSNVTITNSYLRTCGLIFEDGVSDTVTGFYNKRFYNNKTFSLSDRILTLKNSEIETWNFYAMSGTDLVILYCIFGEALSFDEGKVQVHGGICDGSGGYIGTNNGILEILYSQIEAQVLSQGTGISIIIESEIDMPYLNPTFTESSTALFGNTTYDLPVVVLDTSFVLEIFIDTLKNQTTNSIVPITGIVKSHKGTHNPTSLNHYKVRYASKSNTSNKVLIADSLTSQVENDIICEWNTSGLDSGRYIIYIEVFIGDDSFGIEIEKEVGLDRGNSLIDENMTPMKVYNYPNPCETKTTFYYDLNSSAEVNLIIYNIFGRNIETLVSEFQMKGKYQILWQTESVRSGIYFYKLQIDSQSEVRRLIITK